KRTNALAVYVIDLRQKNGAQILNDALRLKTLKLVVTIGSEAAETVLAQHPAAAVIATATMPHVIAGEGRNPLSVLPVPAPLAVLLENVKRVFPAKSRLGMIRNPALPDSAAD